MSGNDKTERDYKDFDGAIEEFAKEEIEKLKKRTNQLKAEAEIVGEAVETSLEQKGIEGSKKKS